MEISVELRKKIHENISKIESAKDVFNLFKDLNYPENVLFDPSSKRKKDTFEFRKEEDEKIQEIYSVLSLENKTHIFLLETASIAPSFVRSVSATFDRQYLNFLLIITIDYSELLFVFPNREKINGDKQKLKLTKLLVNKDDIYYTDVQTISNLIYEEGTGRREAWKQWRSAFSVERVTKNFFEDYKETYFLLKDALLNQGVNKKESHEFTLQLLNRIMFVYFISKKVGWLNTKKFVKWLWESYKKQGKYGANEFYEVWLSQVFFRAFNNQANFIVNLPDEIKRQISNFPFLNGGLFTQNELDELEVQITDELFEKIFEFYEKYNFTIREDMPLEEEVAVDPQMIGYVYESLANVAEEIYDRHDLGIFYTPRVEVDFMARRVVVEYLSKYLTEVPKENLYHLVFDPPEEKNKIVKIFDDNFWRKLEEVLDYLSAVDPACGSGAFLVGLLNVLTELYRLAFQCLDRKYTDFELKKRIIQYSLYGVDIMPWAIHAAELRLWLQLMVETTIKKEELRQHPLLPNLDLNLRIGDSLVQEIGGLFFNLRTSDLDPKIKKKLTDLKIEKRNYCSSVQGAKFKSSEELKKEELRLFEEIIDNRLDAINKEIEKIKNKIRKEKSQKDLTGKPIFDKKKVKDFESEITEYENAIQRLNELKKNLENPEKKPFVWDIDFAEIFGDKNGFDIVIGNPPYVRQEDIAPFNKVKSEVSDDEKEEYKAKLKDSVKNQFPVVKSIDGKSDYYIYFYFHGLSLLNEKGTFCFITSNSWLDVEYGKNLQEFILKYVPILAIYDNPNRAFEHAEINTIIALFGAHKFQSKKVISGLIVDQDEQWTMLNNITKFVMFKKPFSEAINCKNLIDIEKIIENKKIINTADYRVFPIKQEELLEDGWEYPDSYNKKKGKFKEGSYSGNMWGGKFLRAPDIFFKILYKSGSNLCSLEPNIAKVITVGWSREGKNKQIFTKKNMIIEEEEILRNIEDVIKSPKEIKKIYFKKEDTKNYLIHKDILKNKLIKAPLLWVDIRGDKHICHINCDRINFTHNFHGIIPLDETEIETICGLLNSTLCYLFIEILGRKGLGGGGIRLLVNDLKRITIILNPKIFNKEEKDSIKTILKERIGRRDIYSVFDECGLDNSKFILEQEPNPLSDRKELDDLIFDKINLTEQERKDIYRYTCKLAKERIDKVKSLKK